MGDGYLFGHCPGRTWLHRADPRAMLVLMAGIGMGVAVAGPLGLAGVTMGLVAAAIRIRLPIRQMRTEARYFLVLMILVALVRGLTTPGAVVWHWHAIAVTREGLVQGAIFGWRLACMGMAAILFVSITSTSRIIAAVQWALRPVPGVPEAQVATMVGMVVRFLPMVLNQARLNRDALVARGITGRRNPVVRLIWGTVPVLRRVVLQADQLALAMVARGYAPDSTHRDLPPLARRDLALMAAAIVVAGAMHVV